MLRRNKITTTDVVGVKPRVLEILQENPALPYSIVADEVGVTRERVRQIAKRNGYPRRNGVPKWKICPICGKAFSTANLYCSRGCVYKARQKRIVVNCHQCGQSIERTPGTMRSKSNKYFCNRVCFAKWIGKNHSSARKDRKLVMGDIVHEVGSRDEFPLKGRKASSEVIKIYDALLHTSENELIKVWNRNRDRLNTLRIAVKRRASRQGINIASAIREINGDFLLFLMRVTQQK